MKILSLRTTLSLTATLAFAVTAQALTLFSTSFTSVTNDTLPYSGPDIATASMTVGFKPTWIMGDVAVADIKQVNSVSFALSYAPTGTASWGSLADPINAGKMWTSLGDGRYTDGNNAQYRSTGINVQFNSSQIGLSTLATEPDGMAVFNLVFEAKQSINGLSLSFNAGTATTTGVWHANTAEQNGSFNVRIVDAANTASGFSFYTAPQAIGAGAGPAVTAVDQTNATLSAGTYLLQIQLSGKTRTERYTIDDFAFSGTVVPEPSVYRLLLGFAALGGVLLRRRARAW